jgi:hypothetical protein
MTMPHSQLVDTSLTRWYHCITRCVRRAFLLGEGRADRKQWIENRLEELAQVFAISVGDFSVLENHLHVLVRLDPEQATSWSDEDVVQHWGRLFPACDRTGQPLPRTRQWIAWRLQDTAWIAEARQRLSSLRWFMKCLKEPLSRMANREEKTRGVFFEGRFKIIAIIDDESLLTVSTYIDLNPEAAGIASVPENSRHTSIRQRVAHVEALGRTEDFKAAERGNVSAQEVSSGLEDGIGYARLRIVLGSTRPARGCSKG